jgi:hypothetical protein
MPSKTGWAVISPVDLLDLGLDLAAPGGLFACE